MIKGLAITPPVVGRISIGKVVERNGKRLPQKDDEFTVTTQVQNSEGWVVHPLDALLRASSADSKGTGKAKLRSIPVKVLFNDPALNLRSDYCLFDRKTGRAECIGNGESCRRLAGDGVELLPCPSPDQCSFNIGNSCKPYGRLNVVIDPSSLQGDATVAVGDTLGSFVFRTTGYNSIRTLSARLAYFAALSADHLSTLPLELKLRGKSTTMSHRTPIFYADLVVRTGVSMLDAIAQAKREAHDKREAGFDQLALDACARAGFANGWYEDSSEEGLAVVEEFYPEGELGDGVTDVAKAASDAATTIAPKALDPKPKGGSSRLSLAAKLNHQAHVHLQAPGTTSVQGRV